MPNRNTDELFQLVKSLEKSEKRNFKLFAKRNGGGEDLKMVILFDALDKMNEYAETSLLKKNKSISKQQLSNMKAHLYKQILLSIKHTRDENYLELQLNEQMAYVRILYNKGLYLQALKLLEKIRQTAVNIHQLTFQMQAIFFEKKIEALHITHSIADKAEQLAHEADNVNKHLSLMSRLSNLSLQLYSWYIKMGHARDEKDVTAVKMFFKANLPEHNIYEMEFYEKMYLYQSYCWYAFILQDLLAYYRYAQKWVSLFNQEPVMKRVETGQYIKAMHNLLSAHFDLNNYEKFEDALLEFEEFTTSRDGNINTNVRIQGFVYLHIAKINGHFLAGTFTKGLELVPYIESMLQEYKLHLDKHRVLVFYYKIACLYFGSGNNEKTIEYLNKIINSKFELRTDLQCYARLLHLIAHYELNNYDLLEYLIRSVYRFMAKLKNLSIVEEEIFRFLRKAFSLSPNKMTGAFKVLKEKLERLKGNPLETRSFMYLDIIAWLESKLEHIPIEEVREKRFLAGRKIKDK